MVDEKWHDYSQHDTLLLVSCVAKVDATLAERDKRIAELEAERASMIDALCKIATGRIGDGWATDRVQWDMCRSIAKVELDARGVTLPAEAAHARAPS